MFYSRFLKNHATVLAPLNRLLKKGVKWVWTKVEEGAFTNAKKLLVHSDTLVHFDDSLPLFLSCDASSYGIGAVLSHVIDGCYRPVAFASCSLTSAQKNYSQLDKEALSIVFGIQKFRQFLYGREFTLITDHRPLISLFSPEKPVPPHASARLQRWALILASYNYKIEYRNTAAHVDADSMSRVPTRNQVNCDSEAVNCYFFETDVLTTVTHQMIQKKTAVDPVLSKVMKHVQCGWPNTDDCDSNLKPFLQRCNEISIEQGCLLWGLRVIIPTALQGAILRELHETHQGMTKLKAMARSYVWWPGLDKQIEGVVSSCQVCQSMRADPPTAVVHPWTFPSKPWSRLHADFAGPVAGKMYFVLVDAYSKYPEMVHMKSTTAEATVGVLREIFSRHGLPEILVTDNGPQFTSKEFAEFCSMNGILHRTSAAYKPSTNGQAERIVQVLKSALRQAEVMKQNPDTVLQRYLLSYRITPHSTTGIAPSMLLMGRKLRSRLDLIFPSITKKVETEQRSMTNPNLSRGCRVLESGDSVLVRNYRGEDKWVKGKVKKVLGERHYLVEVRNGYLWKRHIDQLLKCSDRVNNETMITPGIAEKEHTNEECYGSQNPVPDVLPDMPLVMNDPEPQISEKENARITVSEPTEHFKNSSDNIAPLTNQRRYPERQRKSPEYLKDYSY